VLLQTVQLSVCNTIFSVDFCNQLYILVYSNFDRAFDILFQMIMNKDYVCHYVFPLCTGKIYRQLTLEEYRQDVLRDKPEAIMNDDFQE